MVKRKPGRAPETSQRGLGLESRAPVIPASASAVDSSFRRGDPERLFLGDVRLRDYLGSVGMDWVVQLRKQIAELDVSTLVRAYSDQGRKAIHPQVMLGLIVYGMLLRQWSLRELEGLARRDLGAFFICGGEQPDHSTIGKFIQMHAQTMTDEFFVSVTRQLLAKLRIPAGDVAVDGTVIEAAASRFGTLRAEAARLAADQAALAAAAAPADTGAQANADRARAAAEAVEHRAEQRKQKGEDPDGARIAPSDPDAVIQPRKDGANRPAYKPSVAANAERFIVGQQLEASSETRAIEPIFWQYGAIFGAEPRTTMLDAGYFCGGVLRFFLNLDWDILCPSGQALHDDDWEKETSKGKFSKRLFVYQPDEDRFICPSGRTLVLLDQNTDRHGHKIRRYRGAQCGDCPVRTKCTDAKLGRQLTRYPDDDIKAGQIEVMKQPMARKTYKRRSAIVEPVFAELRERQGLKRFHRRGRRMVAAEFALHCIAFNLKRAGRLEAAAAVVFVVVRLHGRSEPAIVIAIFFTASVHPPHQ